MAGFGVQVRKRLAKLRQMQADIPDVINRVARTATQEAVQTAHDNTPPFGGASLAGTNTRTGEMAQAWVTDSITEPINGWTWLCNNKRYASYVNDGHRMDRHFVPTLIVNGNGIEKAPEGDPDAGVMVGTITQYVKGLYMKEKAIGKYKDSVRTNLDNEVRRLMQ